MKYNVLLVQRGISSQSHTVSGKSLKPYGMALQSAEHQGVVFELTMEEYIRDAHDLIGNTMAGQQWVPEFKEAAPATGYRRQCSIPAGCNFEADYESNGNLFCYRHAPFTARKIWDGAPPIPTTPAATAPFVADTPGQVIEGAGDAPREVLPPPVLGSADEGRDQNDGREFFQRPVPMPVFPTKSNSVQKIPASNEAEPIADPKAEPKAEPTDTEKGPSLVRVISDIVSDQLGGVEARLMAALNATRAPQKASGNGSRKQGRRLPAKEPTPFQLLQKDAKELKINTYGKSAETLRKEIDEKLAQPVATATDINQPATVAN